MFKKIALKKFKTPIKKKNLESKNPPQQNMASYHIGLTRLVIAVSIIREQGIIDQNLKNYFENRFSMTIFLFFATKENHPILVKFCLFDQNFDSLK